MFPLKLLDEITLNICDIAMIMNISKKLAKEYAIIELFIEYILLRNIFSLKNLYKIFI